MLQISQTSVTELLMDIIDDEFGRDNYDKDKARILLVSSIFKKLTKPLKKMRKVLKTPNT